MLAVIESNLEPRLRFLAFVLASYGNDDGKRIFPSLSLLEKNLGLKQNAIRDQRKELLELKVLQRDGTHAGKFGPIPKFRLNFEALAAITPSSNARSDAARRREQQPSMKQRRRERAKDRLLTPYTAVEGVSGQTPSTTVLEPHHGRGETPSRAVVNPLHDGGPIDQISYVREELTVQPDVGAGAPRVAAEAKTSTPPPLADATYAALADRALELALKETSRKDLRTVCDYLDLEIANCRLPQISRLDIKAIAHAAIQRHDRPAHRRRSA